MRFHSLPLRRWRSQTILSVTLMLLAGVFILSSAYAADSPLTVDAGPDKILAFPAKDLTLFGHATNHEHLTLTWSLVTGPAPVRFSAPWGLATTVTFTMTGTYEFELSASDGSSKAKSSMKVTVNPASSQTEFYVDPNFTGKGNGTAESPWKSFQEGNPDGAAQWATINSALKTKPVIIYFSARQTAADTAEEITGAVHVQRTDKSSNRLTLDGMSKYNTNHSNPSWVDYTGKQKMRLRTTEGSMALGWYSNPDADPKMHYVTMRGFEVTGVQARILWGGSHTVLEYIWSHDVTDMDPQVYLAGAISNVEGEIKDGGMPQHKDIGRDNDITVRNILIERGMGEGIYLHGNYQEATYDGIWPAGWPEYGNTHWDLLIESNTVRDPGKNGGQGDGIDLKAGLQNVTIRNNVIERTHAEGEDPGNGGDGIVSDGVFAPGKTNWLIEGNRIYNGVGSGIAFHFHNGTVIRNNIIYKMKGRSVVVYDESKYPTKNIEIYNNTVYGNAHGVEISGSKGIALRNNLIFGNNAQESQISVSNSNHIDSDYNLMAPLGSTGDFREGTHSLIQASIAGIVANLEIGDFHLISSSPAKKNGVNLSATGFTNDFEKVARSQDSAWDIGAYGTMGGGVQPSSADPMGEHNAH